MQADGAGVEAADLEEVLDEALEAADVARQQVERRLRPLGQLVAPRLHHLDGRRQGHQRGAQLVADVGGEAGVTLDAQLQRRGHVVERARQHAEIGVVGRRQPGAEVAAGDRLGGLCRFGHRPHGTTGGEHAEQHAEQGRDHAGQQQRQRHVGQRAVVLVDGRRTRSRRRRPGSGMPNTIVVSPSTSVIIRAGTPSTSTRSSRLVGDRLGAEPAGAGRPLVAVVDHRSAARRAAAAGRSPPGRRPVRLCSAPLDDLGVGVGGLPAGRVALLDEVRAHQPVRRGGEERREGERAEGEDEQDAPPQADAARAPEPAADGSVAAAVGRRRGSGVVGSTAPSGAPPDVTVPLLSFRARPPPEPCPSRRRPHSRR